MVNFQLAKEMAEANDPELAKQLLMAKKNAKSEPRFAVSYWRCLRSCTVYPLGDTKGKSPIGILLRSQT